MSGVANSLNVADTVNTVIIGNGAGFSVLGYSATGGTSNIVSRDSNGNSAFNSVIAGYATTATAASTTTLTVASKQQQFFTGSTTQTVLMPAVSTLVLGQSFKIDNISTGVVTVQSSGANTIQAMAASTTLVLTVISITGTTAASWSTDYTGAGSTGISALAADSGSASGSTVTVTGGSSGAVFTGSSATLTESFNYLTMAATGSGGTNGVITLSAPAGGVATKIHTYGNFGSGINNQNFFAGDGAGNFSNTGARNYGIGGICFASVTSAINNVALGYQSLNLLQTGSGNVCLGTGLVSLLTGSSNISIGQGSGDAYVSAESSNILLNHIGVTAESNCLRIGNATGTSAFELNKAFISGINGVTVSNPILVYTNTSTDQLGTSASLITAPVSSATATTAFGTSLTAGTSEQNTLGYDILLNIVVSASLATTATIVMGVGPATGPTTQTVFPSFTVSAAGLYSFTAYVPSNYYVVVNTTGTITVASINVQAMAI